MQATIRIERYADQGRCVGHIDGRVVFVRFALPGELVTVAMDEPHERKDRFWTAEVVEVKEPSPDRVEPAWQLAGPLSQDGGVGGADLIHVSLPGQLAWKSHIISEQMQRMGHLDVGEVQVERLASDLKTGGLHWRTRIEMITDDQGRPSMRRRGSHERVVIHTMPLATRALLVKANQLGVWQETYQPGSQIRVALPEPRHIDADLADESSLLRAIGDNYVWYVGKELRSGSTKLAEEVSVEGDNRRYEVDAQGFWQIHRQAPVVLSRWLMDLTKRLAAGGRLSCVWDLYSGSGLFTLPLSQLVDDPAKVVSIEGQRTAVANLRHNLEAAGVGKVHARTGDVAKSLTHLPKALRRPDLIVLDPPRSGAKANVCRLMAQSGASHIIYIACDPTSLARDASTLVSLGYELTDIKAFDIYPMTHHVETVAMFSAVGVKKQHVSESANL